MVSARGWLRPEAGQYWPPVALKAEKNSVYPTKNATSADLIPLPGMAVGYSLSKSEILRGRKPIAELFDKSSSFFLYPFKVFYRIDAGGGPSKALFVIPRKQHRRAVDRNKIKRRMREAYRLNRPEGYSGLSISAAFVYIARTCLSYREIENKLKTVLHRLTSTEDIYKDLSS